MADRDPFLSGYYWGNQQPGRILKNADLDEEVTPNDLIAQFEAVCARYPPQLLESQGRLPPALIDELKAIQFFGLNIPREYGGLGLPLNQYLKVVEAAIGMNMALGLTAMAHLSIGVKGLLLFGNAAQKQKYLVPAARGDMLFAYALTEPHYGSDARHIESTALLSSGGRHYLLNGRKAYITNANYAGAMTVFAQMDPQRPGYMGAFIVETGWQGVKISKDIPKMGLRASSTAAVQFQDVRIPRENLIGLPGDGFKIAMTILNYGRLALGAASAGMMKVSLEDMQRRSALRKQFGQTINQFELVQEKIVKARVNSYAAATMTAFTARLLTRNPLANVAIESSHCKLFGTTRAWETLYDALQIAGGSGYLRTQPYERRMRDFRVTTIFEGTTEIHSIYPAMTLIRPVGKQWRQLSSSLLFDFVRNLYLFFGGNEIEGGLKDSTVKRAVRFTRWTALLIRFLLLMGLWLYKEKVYQQQFYLRRITYLSMYCLGLLAIVDRLLTPGRNQSRFKSERRYLALFLEEARRYRRGCLHIFPTRRDQITRGIYRHEAA